jgi:hypothetical protein
MKKRISSITFKIVSDYSQLDFGKITIKKQEKHVVQNQLDVFFYENLQNIFNIGSSEIGDGIMLPILQCL